MKAAVDLSVRRPRVAIGIWICLVVGLGLVGLHIERQLNLSNPVAPGSASAHTQQVVAEQFGHESALIADLSGPPSSLRAAGPRIVRALDRIPHVSLVSPWLPESPAALRPKPSEAIVILEVRQPFERVAKDTVPKIRATLDRAAPSTIQHHVTGYADIAGGIEDQTFAAVTTAELIAAPLLFAVLLLVFRSPVAAAVPLCLGFSSVAIGRGLLALLNMGAFSLDAAALSLTSMFGLALGVDYSLLLVSRFREQLAAGEAPADAARRSAETAGRTIQIAGLALAVGMVVGYFIAPNQLIASGNVGALVAVFVSVGAAMLALPALLTLLGDRVNLYRFGGERPQGSRLADLAWRAISRPLLAGALVLLVLLALCAPLVGLEIAPPNDGSLSRDSAQLADLRVVGTRLGSGWITPYEVVVRARRGLATDPRLLSKMAAWQDRLESDPEVTAAMGPKAIYGGQGPPSRVAPFAQEAQINLELLRAAPPLQRAAAGVALNLDRGGTALRMEVVKRAGFSRYLADDEAAMPGDPLRRQLTRESHAIEASTGAEVSIGGPAADLQDFTGASRERLPVLVLVLSLCALLILLLAIRSLAVALIAVVLNILSVGAALGVLVLGFQHGVLVPTAGPLDSLVVPAVISVAFGLAIDYEVFLLTRVREEMAIAGDADIGLREALAKTAGIITGAALIMCAVFVAFATASIVNLRESGFGLTVAVLIDATIVRLVLLPALIRLLGPRAWWAPAWIGRVARLRPARTLLAWIAVGLAVAVGSLWLAPSSQATKVHTLEETLHMRVKRVKANVLLAKGVATGTVSGPGSFRIVLSNGSHARAAFAGHNDRGSISGTGVAVYRTVGAISYYHGRIVSLHGTGPYVHATSLGITLSGTVNRRTYKLKMHLEGKYRV